jgi:hypothetical protein
MIRRRALLDHFNCYVNEHGFCYKSRAESGNNSQPLFNPLKLELRIAPYGLECGPVIRAAIARIFTRDHLKLCAPESLYGG